MSLEFDAIDPIDDIHSDILCLEDNIEELQAGIEEATATDKHKKILSNVKFCLGQVNEMRNHLLNAKQKLKGLIAANQDKG